MRENKSKARCEIYSRLKIKTLEWRKRLRCCVFLLTFEHIFFSCFCCWLWASGEQLRNMQLFTILSIEIETIIFNFPYRTKGRRIYSNNCFWKKLKSQYLSQGSQNQRKSKKPIFLNWRAIFLNFLLIFLLDLPKFYP